MDNHEKMWISLRNSLNTRIRQYQNADCVTGLDEIAETELEAWQGIVQEMEGLERKFEME
ncbi:hypothetical protein [Staphylococcus hominis]|uniref:hypothetical protein n=1 Tax=Staphylococcus hominis TaxID=1290 RepID=UPI0032190DE0